MKDPQQFHVKDDGVFPNSGLPLLYYPGVLHLPSIFPGGYVRNLFRRNNWTNNWKQGIYTFHHFHSTTHEVLGCIRGETLLQLGGENGKILFVEAGDVLVIPAGVAHINLGAEKDVTCIGGYPDGRDYDMNRGRPGERPLVDRNISLVPLPGTDPVFGREGPLPRLWK